jgi:hypothetical protein
MSKEQRERMTATMKARAFPRNSDLYRWLRANKRTVESALKATGAGWDGLLAVVLDAGIKGRHGTPPNERSVRKVWLRVCADLDAEAAERVAAKKDKAQPHRSRSRGDWQPPINTTASATPAITPLPQSAGRGIWDRNPDENLQRRPPPDRSAQPAPGGEKKKLTYDDLPPEAKAQFDRLRQDFAETDRKRFGRF